MKKLVPIVAVAIGFGAAVGYVLTQAHYAGLLDVLNADLRDKGERLERAEANAAAVEKEKALLLSRLESLEQQYASLQNQSGARLGEAVDMVPEQMDVPEQDPAMEQVPLSTGTRRASRGPDASGQDNADGAQPEDGRWSEDRQTQFRERMQTFEQAMSDRVDTFLHDEASKATDAASQQRMQLLQQYAGEMMGLRTAMRDAQTDEDRAVLRDSMRETYGNINQLIQEQQDAMLRTLATNNGITDAARQDAFIAQAREVQGSPFFQTERLMGPGFGGGGGRFFWGGGEFGGRRGRQ